MDGSFWLPEGASTLAPTVDSLFNFVTIVSTIIFIGVVVGLFYFAWKYRRRTPEDVTEYVEESKWLEISWIVLPTILVLITFTWGFKAYVELGVAPPDSYEIQVTAYQWGWNFEYPEGKTTTNEIVVPTDRPVKLIMNSTDVLHSFFIPQFRVKQDVVPGRYTSLWFEATRADTFDVYCTEYCGTQHSGMIAPIVAVAPDEFGEWLRAGEGEGLSLEEYGEVLYSQQNCNTCHSLDGSRLIGPSFQNLFGAQRPLASGESVEADENYLRTAILAPAEQVVAGYPPAMPATYANLSDRQVNSLIAFIKAQQ